MTGGGLCKHRIALLLAWVREPESFREIQPLDDLLRQRSQEDLIQLIKDMLKRQPDLLRLVELPVQPSRPAGDILIQQATDEEWVWLEAKIQQAVAATSGWGKEYLVRLLASRLVAQGREDEAEALTFEQGLPEQKTTILVKQKRFDEAIALAKIHFNTYPGLVTRFAESYLAWSIYPTGGSGG